MAYSVQLALYYKTLTGGLAPAASVPVITMKTGAVLGFQVAAKIVRWNGSSTTVFTNRAPGTWSPENGALARWEVSPLGTEGASVDDNGNFTAKAPGNYALQAIWVTPTPDGKMVGKETSAPVTLVVAAVPAAEPAPPPAPPAPPPALVPPPFVPAPVPAAPPAPPPAPAPEPSPIISQEQQVVVPSVQPMAPVQLPIEPAPAPAPAPVPAPIAPAPTPAPAAPSKKWWWIGGGVGALALGVGLWYFARQKPKSMAGWDRRPR